MIHENFNSLLMKPGNLLIQNKLPPQKKGGVCLK